MIAEPLITYALPTQTDRVLIVDVSNMAHRAAWANRDLVDSKGQSTGGIFGSIRILTAFLRNDLGPGGVNIHFCYDGNGARARRQVVLPSYKANRGGADGKPNPVPAVKDVLKYVPGLHIEMEGREGDDAICWNALAMARAGKKVLILTADNDLVQLRQHAGIEIYSPTLKRRVYEADVTEKYYGGYHQIPLVKAVIGDSSDGISGVKGLLKKHVAYIIGSAPSLDNPDSFYKNIELNRDNFAELANQPGPNGSTKAWAKTIDKLMEAKDQVRTNFQVVLPDIEGFDVKQHVSVTHNIEENQSALSQILLDHDCKSLPAQIGILFGQPHYVKTPKATERLRSDLEVEDSA